MNTEAGTGAAGPVDPVGTDLDRILRTHKLGHAAFLELLLADELNRRESRSAAPRAARAGLDLLEAEMRRIAAVDLLIIDDFAIKALDATQTNDFYEIVVERHRHKSTIISSNREPAEWLAMTSDTCSPNPPSTGSPKASTPWSSKDPHGANAAH